MNSNSLPVLNLDDITSLFTDIMAQQRTCLSDNELCRLLDTLAINTTDTGSDPACAALSLNIDHNSEFGMVMRVGLTQDALMLANGAIDKKQVAVQMAMALTNADSFVATVRRSYAYQALLSTLDNTAAKNFDKQLHPCITTMMELANYFSPLNEAAPCVIDAFEIGSLSLLEGRLVARQVRCHLSEKMPIPTARPIAKIKKLLHPQSIGIIGVSASKMNFGRIILKNLLASGYPQSQLTIIRPGESEIDGVACAASLTTLPHKLDLLVIAVGASAVFTLVDELIDTNAAESVILIPGGLGETQASIDVTAKMDARINAAHARPEGGPIFLGGNCLGVVSHPGNYDSWFIPGERLPKPQKKQQRNSALISQSGAFMISRISKNPWLDPAYMTALGNQSDITHGDMLSYYADHVDIDTIGLYIEGFNKLDGLHFAQAVRRAVCNGKQVIVYKAGRTAAGCGAARGHTASITGDYELCDTLLTEAGAMLAGSLCEFDDLFYIADQLRNKRIQGNRLAAVSGAGFETVGMADSVSPSLVMAPLSSTTKGQLEKVLIAKRLD
ncbi:MAG: CoA-binding protein, partial [Proteobacteria bacterium]|nr:CoA-binding protein [Pseudomonadota bacterium]